MIVFFTPHNVQSIVLKYFHTVVDEEIVNPDRMNSAEIVGGTKRTKNESCR